MELYLMQHGLALSEAEDAARPLSPAGVAGIQAAARAMKRLAIHPDGILASPKKRARQTAALIAEGINYPYSDLLESELLAPDAEPDALLEYLQSLTDRSALLLVGHLPSLPRVVALLLGGAAAVHFENGGLCRIDAESLAAGAGILRFSLTAEQLRLMAG